MQQKININLIPNSVTPVIHLSQNDYLSGELVFYVYHGSTVLTENIINAVIKGIKPDDNIFIYNSTEIDGNVVTFDVKEQMTAVSGKTVCKLRIQTANGAKHSKTFILDCEADPTTGGTASESDIEALEELIESIEGDIVDARTAADEAADYAEQAKSTVVDVRRDITNIQQDVSSIQQNVSSIQNNVAETKNDVSDLQTNLNSEISNRATQDAVLSARMDEFTKLPDGSLSTAADAELADIRVKTDGTTAATAGDAVREQITELKNDFVNKTLMQKCQILTASSENRWDASSVSSGLLHTNGQVYTGGSYDDYCYYDIGAVSEGDIITSYRASGGVIVTQNMERVVAYDADNNVLANSGAVNLPTYTVPNNVATVKITVRKAVLNDNYMVLINAESAPAIYIPYVEPTEYYVATKEFIGEINIDDNTDFDNKYLDFSMVNRVIPSECEIGKFLNGVTGVLSDNASYFVTGYMPIRDGETLYAYGTYTLESVNMRSIAVYNADKELIAGYGVNANTPSITYRDGMAYIRACMLLSNGTGGVWRTPETIMIVADPAPISAPTYESKPKIKGEYTRKKIYVYSTDDESTVIRKMVNAYNLTDCDVIFERSTYMFGDVLPNVMTLYGLSRNEIPVGNNCRYYFNGATLQAEINLETLGLDFNCNLLGTQYKPTNFEMHDGILIATDTRYVVHDEAATLKGSYKHLYQNMIMEYHTNISTDAYRKCIGGGTGASGVIEIVGCKFTTDSTEVDVSYHGNAYDIADAEFMVNVRNCWFSNSFRAGELSSNQTGKLIFANNSTASALQTYARWDTASFLNEVRT